MANFPSKWFDFTTSKEIKRIRKDINNTLSLKIEISVSIILTIIAFLLSEHIKKLDVFWQVFICVLMCLIVLSLFFYTYVSKWCSVKRNGNVIVKGKDAVSTFDDEIVYNVLVAAEYYNSMEHINKNKIESDLIAFYNIEIKYYLTKAIDELLLFNTNYTKIFGNKKNQIPLERLQNILNLIRSIMKCSGIVIDKSKKQSLDGLYDYFFKGK